jgi:hypothetical protein
LFPANDRIPLVFGNPVGRIPDDARKNPWSRKQDQIPLVDRPECGDATGSSFRRMELPWRLIGMVTVGTAAVALLTSTLSARRAAAVPVLEATGAE